MRPHLLRATAFGAFGGTVEISFDDLAIAAEFVQHVRHEPATDGERRLFADAFEAVRTGQEAD